jgi:hypothetical protein
MPVFHPEPQPIHAACDECDAECELTEAEDEEGDLVPPPGWAIIRVTRTVANPDYLDELDQQAAYVEGGITAIKAQVEGAGGEFTAQMALEAKEALTAESMPQSSQFWAQELEGVLCPEHAGYLQTRLGLPEWEEE